MQRSTTHRRDNFRASLGQRRGLSDLARFSLDLGWARADSASAARLESYPSPPMSGSPPLPPKTSQEAAERSQGGYLASAQDVYHGIPTAQGDERGQTLTPASARAYASEAQERASYGFHRPEGPVPRQLSYQQQPPPQQQLGQVAPQQSYLPSVAGIGAGPMTTTTTTTTRSLPGPSAYHPAGPLHPTQEAHHSSTSKPQRKTKGHVASACVPCKKAHLRCDAQRPCSRCLSNGKEEACVDVQHKKRGRPRLRDDREMKFDTTSRFGSGPADPMRRPISSIYGSGGSSAGPSVAPMSMGYDDSLRRTQSYRVLKSQPTESIAPRFPERAAASDANIFPPPLSISTRLPEPAAFLTTDLEFAKSSITFQEAIGRAPANGVKLIDLVVPQDREKALNLQRRIQEEQKRKNPTYLPPIFNKAKEEEVMQKLGFEEISRYPLDWQEYFSFVGQDGQVRSISVRLGLAMKDSIYFIVLVVVTPRSMQYPTPSPNPREMMTYSYQYSQPTPVSATFDQRQRVGGDAGYGTRPMGQPGPPPQISTGLSPGFPTSYSASPSRSEYLGGTTSPYQTPRSELHPATARQAQAPPSYQLPPIRNQQPDAPQQQEPSSSHQGREERSRVDIGGLLDRTDRPRSPQR
ncbi:hypothetical protein QBC37DRAFT_141327 [Rhypophila decipiens]|uniref:Zn(2)-C6 fungal-type domain-containing protein n=1 Tax=Rhypophila decipiens TaxID=261697 RepID=A0AAN6Y8X0_9PEZI|nr:hypothetical protein QBC37DRAFT_141327 [Rhypophila decipiens]